MLSFISIANHYPHVPKREFETTEVKSEVVERTTTEEIVVCDSCGMESDSDSIPISDVDPNRSSSRNIYEFQNDVFDGNLYFCENCLTDENENIIPIKNRVSKKIEGMSDRRKGNFVALHFFFVVFLALVGFGALAFWVLLGYTILMVILDAVF